MNINEQLRQLARLKRALDNIEFVRDVLKRDLGDNDLLVQKLNDATELLKAR